MSNLQAVRLAVAGPVCTIHLSRPAQRNAVDGPTAKELREAFDAFERDEQLRVAVLTGDGGQFCSGADLGAIGDPARRNAIEPTGSADGPMGPVYFVQSLDLPPATRRESFLDLYYRYEDFPAVIDMLRHEESAFLVWQGPRDSLLSTSAEPFRA